jgi:hypothetical protein
MWSYILQELEPFLAKGYITTYDTAMKTWNRGPLLIIGTGDTPLPHVYHQQPRVIFLDAPLIKLAQPFVVPQSAAGPGITIQMDDTIAPIATSYFSPDWRQGGARAVQEMKAYTDEAQRRGIRSRWWGEPRTTKEIRQAIWSLQRDAGVDWVNADDLMEAVQWLSTQTPRL